MNFSRFCAIGCFFLFLLLAPAGSLAATVHGTVHEWYSFEPLNNAVIKVNSTPEQSLVATDATYSFNLSQGTYLITASYFESGIQIYTGEEIVKVSGEGNYVLDLLLFPTDGTELLDQSNFEEPGQDFETSVPLEKTNSQTTKAIFILFILSVLILFGYFWKNRQKKTSSTARSLQKVEIASEKSVQMKHNEEKIEKEDEIERENEIGGEKRIEIERGIEKGQGEAEKGIEAVEEAVEKTGDEETEDETWEKTEKEGAEKGRDKSGATQPEIPEGNPPKSQSSKLPDDLEELLEFIRANGNRITQRELRKKSKYSESKVSLMLSDLEERGLIEKFKKGRGNIIRIPDDQIQKQNEPENKIEESENKIE